MKTLRALNVLGAACGVSACGGGGVSVGTPGPQAVASPTASAAPTTLATAPPPAAIPIETSIAALPTPKLAFPAQSPASTVVSETTNQTNFNYAPTSSSGDPGYGSAWTISLCHPGSASRRRSRTAR